MPPERHGCCKPPCRWVMGSTPIPPGGSIRRDAGGLEAAWASSLGADIWDSSHTGPHRRFQGPSPQAPGPGLAPWRPGDQETPFLAQQLGAHPRRKQNPRRPLPGNCEPLEGWERNGAEGISAAAAALGHAEPPPRAELGRWLCRVQCGGDTACAIQELVALGEK